MIDIKELIEKDKSYTPAVSYFYQLIYDLQDKLTEFESLKKVESEVIHDPTKKQVYLKELQDFLCEKIEQFIQNLQSSAWVYSNDFILQIRYIYAVYIDEALLNTEWFGGDEWRNYLIEYRMFTTRDAGDEIFYRIDAALKYRTKRNKQLAKLYLIMLGAGFRGKYRDSNVEEIVAQKNRLCLYLGEANTIYGTIENMFPGNYKKIMSKAKPKLLPIISRYKRKILLVCGLFIILSFFVWETNSGAIRGISKKIRGSLTTLEAQKA